MELLYLSTVGCIFVGMVDTSFTTQKQLLEIAQQQGYKVTSRQLVRWHCADLLPRPKQYSLGRGYGTQTVYPENTSSQLLALCCIHTKEHRLDYIAWELWWQGYRININLIRRFINKRILQDWKSKRKVIVDSKKGGLSHKVLDYIKYIATKRLKNKTLGAFRKLVKQINFSRFAQIFLEILSGQFKSFRFDCVSKTTDEEQFEVAIAFGLEPDQIDSNKMSDRLEDEFKKLASFIMELTDSPNLLNFSSEDFLLARDELKIIVRTLNTLPTMPERINDVRTLWLSRASTLLGNIGSIEQAFLILVWLKWRNFPGAKIILASCQQWLATAIVSLATETLKQEIPALIPMLTAEKMKRAMKSEKAMHLYISKLQDYCQGYQDELTKFWQRHPEFQLSFPSNGNDIKP